MQCQTNELKTGADSFLAVEASRSWDRLPAAFWEDYTNCATVSNLPAHTLRAISYLEKLRAPNPAGFDTAADIAHHRIIPFDPKKNYDPKDVWQGANPGETPDFTSTMCGVYLRVHGKWEVNQMGLAKGGCIAYFNTGPYTATTRKLYPSILLLVQQPEENETLAEFSKKYMKYVKDGTFEPFVPTRCPAVSCIAMKAVQPGMYKKDGDGHGHIVVFEREEPQFPGLIFEAPVDLPKSEGGEGPKYYRPSQAQGRIPGKLYYLVMLDTAASIEESAMKDYDFFLQNLSVE